MNNSSPYSTAITGCGIDFTYDFTADHDRKIVANNGWSIYLGRGLDIFEPYPKFTMGCAAQENRRCRAFSVTYTN
jgi:ATP-dependent Lon protease